MTPTDPPRRQIPGGTLAAGWSFSILLHAALLIGALLFTDQLHLVFQSEPFTWNVAMVSPSSSQTAPPASVLPNPPTPAPPASAIQPAPVSDIQPTSQSAPATHTPASLAPIEPRAATDPPSTPPAEPTLERPPVDSLSWSAAPPHPPAAENPLPSEPTPAQPPQTETSAPAEPIQTQAPQVAAIPPGGPPSPSRMDYSWLTDQILRRVEELKRYPREARLERAQGRVVVRVVIREDGSVADATIATSSGFASLDQAALDLMRQAGPFTFSRPLGRPQLTIKIPINFSIDRS